MPFTIRPCSICIAPNRAELEKRIVSGEAAVSIANDTGCSRRQLLNHFSRGHVQKAAKAAKAGVVAAQQAQIEARGVESTQALTATVGDLLKQATDVLANVTSIYDDAIASGQHGLALAAAQKQMNAVARVKELIEVAGKLSGEYDQKVVNLYILPEWRNVMDFLVNTLAPFPEARQAVIEGLRARVRRTNVAVPELEGPDTVVIEAEVVA